LNEAEFQELATSEGFDAPESRSQPPNKFFETHAHERELIVLVTAGAFTVAYGEDATTFGPGEMCRVKPGVPHTDAAGPEGASYILAWR